MFDITHIEGVDIDEVPLLQRKALLQRLLDGNGKELSYSSHVQGDGAKAFDAASEQGFEIISKRVSAPWAWRRLAQDQAERAGRPVVRSDVHRGSVLRGKSEQKILRQPSLKALRLDKSPRHLNDSDQVSKIGKRGKIRKS